MDEQQMTLLNGLLDAGVEFVVVGGLAVIAHGYVRTTHDMDLYLRPTTENAERAFAAIGRTRLSVDGVEARDLLSDEFGIRLRNGDHVVDFLNEIGALGFEHVWRNRVDLEIQGRMVPFISKSDLLEVKRAVGRHRDMDDVEHLELLRD